MRQFARSLFTSRFSVLLALAFASLLSGCTQDQLPRNTTVVQNADGSLTVSILPAPGQGGIPQSVLVPANAIPPRLRGLAPRRPAPPAVRPGNGGTATPNPTIPSRPAQPTPPPTVVTNPTKPPVTGGSPTEKARLESDFGVTVGGKDATNSEYLGMLRQAMQLYPSGSFKGLQVYLDEESLQKTGGVGGVWQMQGSRAWITVYQNSLAYIHVAVHELAHHVDLAVNRGQATSDLMSAATVNGTIPATNIPSAYAKYGLEQAQTNPEWTAETISWSLDTRGVPGFQAYNWRPTQPLVDHLGKFVEKSKIIWNAR